MSVQAVSFPFPKHYLRIAVSTVFFLPGIIFASWASRIATIQQTLDLSDAALGAILFCIPVGLIVSLPVAGWLISRIGSRMLVLLGILAYGVALVGLGASTTVPILMACMVAFGFASNSVNIAVNTQAVATEKLYHKPIMASFHGVWSLAGFAAAGFGTFMIGKNILPLHHFALITVIVVIILIITYRYLLDDKGPAEARQGFVMPDRPLIKLGIIAFCSLICEGAMFDWSVIYFKKVLNAHDAWMGAGYTIFMCTMAMGRFIADWFAHRFGLKQTLQVSGLLTAAGLLIAVIFPTIPTAMLGFLLVGFGVSSVVPMVYSVAGKSKTMSPGMALAAVSTIGFVGFLVGPPVIGFVAGLFSLRVSFVLIAVMGLCVTGISSKVKL